MNEADILAMTYFHTCTIYRPVKHTEDGITRQKYQAVYTDIPCAVSSGGGSSEGRNEESQPVEYTDTLFVRPEIDVRAGDKVEAKIYEDRISFLSLEGRRYPSHRQVPLIYKGRA